MKSSPTFTRHLAFLVFTLFHCFYALGQCPSGTITLTTQSEIDNFKINYPSCTEIQRDLIIEGSDITNLDGLEEVTKINRHLQITDTSLSNLLGLEGLIRIEGGVTIWRNYGLLNLLGMGQLTFVGEQLDLSRNSALISLEGLENVQSIGSLNRTPDANNGLLLNRSQVTSLQELSSLMYLSGLQLNDNDIVSLAGLENITYIDGGISIGGEDIADLTGLDNVTIIGDGLRIQSNANLTSLQGLGALISVGGLVSFSGNLILNDLTGLDSLTEITGNPQGFSGRLSIKSMNLTSLAGLTNLTTVEDIEIAFCPQLTNLIGLSSIQSVTGDFTVRNNENLQNLQGIESLQTIEGKLYIRNNFKMTSLTGLGGLQTIGDELNLQQNILLSNLNGLSQLSAIGKLEIHGNDELISLDGLETLHTLSNSHISISDNDKLSDLTALGNSRTGGDSTGILGNLLELSQNPALTSLSGLENLGFNGRQYTINIRHNTALLDISAITDWYVDGLISITLRNNTNLSICQLPPICNFMLNKDLDFSIISGNSGACENEEDLAISCSPEPECPAGDIVLSSQEAVDNFASDYAYCTKPQVSITIEGNDIVNLNGLLVITEIGGDLVIRNNSQLQHLSGLERVVSVSGELIIENNPEIKELSGLRNIDGLLISNLIIRNNAVLSSCNVASVCDFMAENVDVAVFENNTGNCDSAFDVMMKCHNLCPSSRILLRTQSEVDNFKINYPNCTVPRAVQINATNISNLDGLAPIMATTEEFLIYNDGTGSLLTDISGLAGIRYVGNYLRIEGNQDLPSLAGLESLKKVEWYLSISGNPLISDLTVLSNLEHVLDLSINEMHGLTDLNGLQSLKTIGRFMVIASNNNLKNLDGLDHLEISDIRGVEIINNPNLERLTNLGAIRSITTKFGVGGDLKISYNNKLTDISGLSNLETMENQLTIEQNASLTNLLGMESVSSVGKRLHIKGNDNLTTLSGLDGLAQVGTIQIQDNPSLVNLNGLENLGTIKSILDISNNDLLNDIQGISNSNLSSVTRLNISQNPELSICNQPNLCEYLYYSDRAYIQNNAIGCSGIEEVITTCANSTNIISGTLHFDANGNGCDPSDTPIPNMTVETTDGTKTFRTFTNDHGEYTLLVRQGNFDTSALTNGGLIEFTPNSKISVFADSGNSDTSNFCATASVSEDDLAVVLIPLTEPRPGFDVAYRLVYQNKGNTTQNGTLSLEYESGRLSFLGATPTQDRGASDFLEWNYLNLKAFESRAIDLSFNIAAPPTTNILETIRFEASISSIAADRNPSDNTFELEEILIGSYDPNDIRVLEGEEVNIDNTDEYLNYIIRFQNTGTASAINVKIDHELDADLDWETFTPISSSHLNITTITDGKDVEFLFENINLPDSTANEPASHGHVAFKIKPKTDVAVGDVVRGSASIYFDFNPPIITNTVSTKIVDGNASLVSDALIISPVSCAGETDAAIQVTAMGGNEPYMYELLDKNHNTLIAPHANNILKGIGAGHYNIRVVDSSGEESVFDIILQNPLPMSLNYTLSDINCNGASDGRIEVLVSGGTAPYIYSMNGEAYQESGVFKHLAPGLYSIEVIDANGCSQYLPPIGVQEHLELKMAVTLQDVLCKGATDGEIEITAAGGFAPYLYSLNESIYQSNNVFSNLLAGQYTVEILDANGCIVSNQVIISEPNGIDFDNDGIGDDCDDDIDGDGIANDTDDCAETPLDTEVDASGCAEFTLPSTNFTVQTNSETCASSNNGSILVTAAENLDYIATLASGSDFKSKGFRTFASFQDLVAGHYDVCVTVAEQADFERCFSVQITEPEPLNVDSKVDVTGKSVSLKMRGGAHYTITLNGQTHTTSESEITLPIFTIENQLSVKTDQDCQGVFKEAFYVNVSNISIYPNPVSDGELSVLVPSEPYEKVYISLFTNSGRLVLQNAFENTENPFKLNVSRLTSGTYNLKIETESRTDFRRIIIK